MTPEGSENLPPQVIHCFECGYTTIIFDSGDGLKLPECAEGCGTRNGAKTTMTWGDLDAGV